MRIPPFPPAVRREAVIFNPETTPRAPGAFSREAPAASIPRIARICALGLSLDELLGEVCREVLSLSGAQACCLVLLPDDASRESFRRIHFPEDAPDPGVAYAPGPHWDRLVDRLRSEYIPAVEDILQLSPDDPLRAVHARYPVRGALLVPLKFGSRLLGMLALHTFSAPRRWRDEEIASFEMAGAILSAALERRRMENLLRASEAQYRFLAENALDFISLHDPEGRYVYASPAVFRMLGHRPEVMTGCPLTAFLHPGDAGNVMRENARLAAGEVHAVTLHYRMRRKDGGYMEVETVSSAVPGERGEVRQVLRITRDISERKQMEARLFENQKMETIGMLAGGVAHEFNNLLVGINGSVEMLGLLLAGNPETASYLDMIERMGNRAVTLTHQLLAYARQGKYVPELVPLNHVVLENLPVLKTSLPASVNLVLELAEVSPMVVADIAQIRQVVMNLALNAAEAMPQGGTLTIRTRTEPEGPSALLEVQDAGCGMDGRTLERIFEPFFSTKFVGRGMGLAAVRGIVDNHSGAIDVASEIGRGTCFSVRLPLAMGTGVLDESAASEPGPLRPGRGLILVADDEDDVRTVVSAMLASLGYRVVEAVDGREAVEIFREHAGKIDLVLLDLMMPGMTGDQAFAEIRRIRSDVPAILASGYDESGRVREIVADGFGGFLQKPFRRGELGQKVEALLSLEPGRA